jgi:Zn-finger nucleic acid-binding protein
MFCHLLGRGAKTSEAIDSGDVHIGHKMNKITAINCPKCNQPMVEKVDVDQHHIHFEACENCKGIYLDAGEFKDLKNYNLMDYLRGLFHRTPKPKKA